MRAAFQLDPRSGHVTGSLGTRRASEACSAPSLAMTSMRKSPGGSASERHVDVAEPAEAGGRHRQHRHLAAVSIQHARGEHGRAAGALRADAKEQAIGAAELSFDHRHRLRIGGERLPLGQRAPAEHLRRAQRQSQAEARHVDLSHFAIEHFARRVLDGNLELDRPWRHFELDSPGRNRLCGGSAALNSRRRQAATRR